MNKLVPIEPTEAMIFQAEKWLGAYAISNRATGRGLIEQAYKAMLAAAPEQALSAGVSDEISHLRVVAKRNLKSYIERHITTDDLTKKTMLCCLEELS